jgi:HTH-type transcriptional regulator / antitoxin HigA
MGEEQEYINEIYRYIGVSNSKKLIDLINERMESLGISTYQMGKMLSINKSSFDRLIKKIESGDIEKVDFYDILKISEFLGISINEISQLYVSSLKKDFIAELELSKKANLLHKYFDLKGLKSIGFIKDVYDVKAIEERILKFFDITSLQQYNSEIGAVLFSKTKKTFNDKMRELWIRSAYYQFSKIDNPNDFDKEKLLTLIPKIRPYTRHEDIGLITILKALYNVGVTVIVQKHLLKTQVRGGTFVVNNKPYIIITDLYGQYATLWFALLHEIYHVLYDFEDLKIWNYHLTGDDEPDLGLHEKEDLADYFSIEMLFPKEKMEYIKYSIDSPLTIQQYAEQNKIHPGIIYSFYCYEQKKKYNKNDYPKYRQYIGSSEKALALIRTNPWTKETIYEEIEKIKEVLETIYN